MYTCDSWVLDTASGEQRCVAKCPDGTKLGKDYQCETCEMRNEATPYWDGKDCVASCGDYQVSNIDKNCLCKEGLVKNDDYTKCVPPTGKTWRDFASICAEDHTVASLTGDRCANSCGENEVAEDGKLCVCDKDSIIHEDGTHCVKRTECQRTFSKNGVSVCLAAEVCKGDLKLSLNDDHLCVSDCDFWTEDELTKELRCVTECPEGSWTDEGKLCKTCAMRNEDTPYWNGKDCVAGCGDYQVSDVDKK